MDSIFFQELWTGLLWPICRISLFVALGLFVAHCIESFAWSRKLAKLAKPITQLAHLSEKSAASFSLAFVSGISANSVLAENFADKSLSKKELLLANLLNSLPRFFLHLPTVFFLTLPFIHEAAFAYIGITFFAALLQTVIIIFCGRYCLEKPSFVASFPEKKQKFSWTTFRKKVLKKLKRRFIKLMQFMVPIYCLFYLLSTSGALLFIKEFILEKAWFLQWLPPESIGIILLHVTAEFSAGLAAASFILAENSLTSQQIIITLLVGNLLATPVRAIRHQFPSYAGMYPLKLAVYLITINQAVRAGCLVVVGIFYYWIFC